MKEISGFEISFDQVINEQLIIQWIKRNWNLNEDQIWNWDWEGEPGDDLQITFSSVTDETGTLVRLLLNKDWSVEDLFELKAGKDLSSLLNTSVIVTDPTSEDRYLQIFPDGLINGCIEGSNDAGETVYDCVVERNITEKELQTRMEVKRS